MRAALVAAAIAAAGLALILRRRRRLRLASLDEIGTRYVGNDTCGKDKYTGGDKTSAGQNFTPVYESLLAHKRHEPNVVLLEIGVWYGKSLAMWADYFDSVTVHGVDINLKRWHSHRPELERLGAFSRNRVVLHEFDTFSESFAAFSETLPPLDVVVDDGCHTAHSQYHLFRLLFRRVRSGGCYIVEDLEQPAALFWLGGGASQRERPRERSMFAFVAPAVANEQALTSAAAQHEAEVRVEEEERRLQSSREKLAQQISELQNRATSDDKLKHALGVKQAELKSMPGSLSKGEKRRLRERFAAELDEAAALARAAVCVEVRRNLLIFHRR